MAKVKKPRLVKSKEELLAELKKSAEWNNKMNFIKKEFYPALIEASVSIEDAKQFLSSIPTLIMQMILEVYKDKHFGELNLASRLDTSDPKYNSYVKLIELFNDKKVFEVRDLINGMEGEIQMFISDEMKERPLASLKTAWLDES